MQHQTVSARATTRRPRLAQGLIWRLEWYSGFSELAAATKSSVERLLGDRTRAVSRRARGVRFSRSRVHDYLTCPRAGYQPEPAAVSTTLLHARCPARLVSVAERIPSAHCQRARHRASILQSGAGKMPTRSTGRVCIRCDDVSTNY